MPVSQFLTRNNFYVLIDDHSEDPTVQNDPNQWVQYWAQLMTDITADPTSRNRVMVDLLNEPDHASYKWDTVGALMPTWATLPAFAVLEFASLGPLARFQQASGGLNDTASLLCKS